MSKTPEYEFNSDLSSLFTSLENLHTSFGNICRNDEVMDWLEKRSPRFKDLLNSMFDDFCEYENEIYSTHEKEFENN